jgi:hypothetical protein
MTLERFNSLVSRVLFFAAFLLLAIAVGERLANLLGYTFLRQTSYAAGRLLEFAAIFLIFVIALLLRQIREELKKS